jgi:glycosyltransferase-like protein
VKIALFTYSTKPRGSVIHTLELGEALQEMGHQVCIYALDKDGQGFDYPLSSNYCSIPAQSAPAMMDALIQQRIQEFVDYLSQSRLTYDCYHAQDCIAANALAILVRQQKIPHFVRTVHHIEDFESPYLQECQDRSIRAANLCLCVSQYWQEELEKHYQIHAPRVINGVNLRRFSSVPQTTDGFCQQQWNLSGSPLYLTIGGIEPRKNSLGLLRAFAYFKSLVRSTYPQASLVIAGGASVFDYRDYRQEFFNLAKKLDLQVDRDLILLGIIPDADLPALYRAADVFVFPSLKEGWGLVILEAIASGLPIIAPNCPPFTEFLGEERAILVDPQSPEAIALAMVELSNPESSRTLIHNSRLLLDQYTWQSSATMHLQHYQKLLES